MQEATEHVSTGDHSCQDPITTHTFYLIHLLSRGTTLTVCLGSNRHTTPPSPLTQLHLQSSESPEERTPDQRQLATPRTSFVPYDTSLTNERTGNSQQPWYVVVLEPGGLSRRKIDRGLIDRHRPQQLPREERSRRRSGPRERVHSPHPPPGGSSILSKVLNESGKQSRIRLSTPSSPTRPSRTDSTRTSRHTV